MTHIKPNDEWRVDGGDWQVEQQPLRPSDIDDGAPGSVHDSDTCTLGPNDTPCDMCVAADEYERRQREEVNMDEEFDFENVLCVCSYPLDNEGYCVIDTDHRGIYPSGDKSRDLAATAAQLVSISYKRKQRQQALKTLAQAGVFSGSSQLATESGGAQGQQAKTPCDCPLHRLSPEERAARIDAACDAALAENQTEQRLWADAMTVRAALMDVIDEGCQHPDDMTHEWRLDSGLEDFASEQRALFADAVLLRVIELQSPPHDFPQLHLLCDRHKRARLAAHAGECRDCARERL
jgi:hypothetical protein